MNRMEPVNGRSQSTARQHRAGDARPNKGRQVAGLARLAFNNRTSSTSLVPRSVPKDSNQPATLIILGSRCIAAVLRTGKSVSCVSSLRPRGPQPTRRPPRTSSHSHDHDGTAAHLRRFTAGRPGARGYLPAVRTRRRCRRHVAQAAAPAPRRQALSVRASVAHGLPTLATRRLAKHASKLKVDMSGGELPGRKVDPRR